MVADARVAHVQEHGFIGRVGANLEDGVLLAAGGMCCAVKSREGSAGICTLCCTLFR